MAGVCHTGWGVSYISGVDHVGMGWVMQGWSGS